MDISLVIPLLNEEESLRELHQRISEVFIPTNFSYEIIFIDDGSTDNSWEIIKEIINADSYAKGIRFTSNFGKSQALDAGFEIVEGDVIITMDADLQDDPNEIIPLYKMIKEEGYDLVSGWKKVRYDNKLTKNIPSKIFNWSARKISGVKLHDFNCGIKSYRKEVVKAIKVKGDMHRYIPLLAKNKGFSKIGEKQVKHSPRKFGNSKFGNSRFIKGFLDLITIYFISKFGKSPMHFFGTLGVFTFVVGFGLSFYMIVDKLWININGPLLADRIEFYIALFMMSLGVQLFLSGFLGELILTTKPNKKYYVISETKFN